MKWLVERVGEYLRDSAFDAPHGPDAATQIQLMLTYRRLVDENQPLPSFNQVGFKCHSQADEDGIVLLLFSVIGVARRLSVEICAGDGLECNTTSYGFNAFFVKNGLGDDLFPEIAVKDCFGHPKVVWGMRERFPAVEALPWVQV